MGSDYFNKERYYDPTVGAALAHVIREERRKNYKPVKEPRKEPKNHEKNHESKSPELSDFLKEYEKTFKAADPAKRMRRKRRIRNWIHAYEYIMRHCNDPDFSVDKISVEVGANPRRIQQMFDGRGDISKAIQAWNKYKTEVMP